MSLSGPYLSLSTDVKRGCKTLETRAGKPTTPKAFPAHTPCLSACSDGSEDPQCFFLFGGKRVGVSLANCDFAHFPSLHFEAREGTE